MHDSGPTMLLFGALALGVVLYFLYTWLFDTEDTVRPGVSRYRLLTGKVIMNRAPRLCPYHIGASLRPGQLAVLDTSKCELCAKEKVVHLRR